MKNLICSFIVLSLVSIHAMTPSDADSSPTGLWYGTFTITDGGNLTGFSNMFSINFDSLAANAEANVSIPDLGLLNTPLPTSIAGDIVTIAYPPYAELTGELDSDSLNGTFWAYAFDPWTYEFTYVEGTWLAEKHTPLDTFPGDPPGPPCDNLPSIYCIGNSDYCGELVQFDPPMGEGYIDYPMNGETWENQYRSYIRRDLKMLIDYATAKVACKCDDWSYGNFAPLGLIDMSEENGSIPGSSVGYPGHPPGTHENGRDIDTAYYQLYTDDNKGRVVGLNYDYHLVEPPYNFDKWRTALFISYLSEHPRLRVVGVDGQIGLVLDGTGDQMGTFDDLVSQGWIDPVHREYIPLAYEVEDQGWGWFRFHHHHMHVSMNPVSQIVSSLELKPSTLNKKSRGKYVTACIEFNEGVDLFQIYGNSIALILNGHTMVYATPENISLTDYNQNGISDLTIKFDRQRVIDAIENGFVEISLTGLIGNQFFQESDVIRVITPPNKKVKTLSNPGMPFTRPGGRMHWPE